MAKASQVAANTQKQLDRIEAKLDLLLKAQNIKVENSPSGEEPVKPVKTFVKLSPATKPVPPDEQAFLKSGKKKAE